MAIRLCDLATEQFPRPDSRLYVRRKCGFCKAIVIDRANVKKGEPPPACPKCQQKYYAGKLET